MARWPDAELCFGGSSSFSYTGLLMQCCPNIYARRAVRGQLDADPALALMSTMCIWATTGTLHRLLHRRDAVASSSSHAVPPTLPPPVAGTPTPPPLLRRHRLCCRDAAAHLFSVAPGLRRLQLFSALRAGTSLPPRHPLRRAAYSAAATGRVTASSSSPLGHLLRRRSLPLSVLQLDDDT
uniref:Uncharacterized protein n=1 Tax=Leersia perrieri TaxID=77586 RepID=A0A0D9X6C6_9ORYZ